MVRHSLTPRAAAVLSLALGLTLACDKPTASATPDTEAEAEPARVASVFIEAEAEAKPESAATAGPLSPEIASIYRCWFRSPYGYMFEMRGDPLELPHGDFGTLMGGINGILVYGAVNDCAGEVVDQRPRSFSDLGPLEKLAGVPTALDYDTEGSRYSTLNPAFLAWARVAMIPQAHEAIEGVPVALAYQKVFSRFFRLMVESAVYIHENLDARGEATRYLQAVYADGDALEWLHLNYSGVLTEYGGSWDGTTWTPAMSVGFWLRREDDGTRTACWYALLDVVRRFDRPWVVELAQRYPKGWAALTAEPDPLGTIDAAQLLATP